MKKVETTTQEPKAKVITFTPPSRPLILKSAPKMEKILMEIVKKQGKDIHSLGDKSLILSANGRYGNGLQSTLFTDRLIAGIPTQNMVRVELNINVLDWCVFSQKIECWIDDEGALFPFAMTTPPYSRYGDEPDPSEGLYFLGTISFASLDKKGQPVPGINMLQNDVAKCADDLADKIQELGFLEIPKRAV